MNASRKNDRKHAFCLVFKHIFHNCEEINIEEDFEYYMENFAEEGVSEPHFILGEARGVLNNLTQIDKYIAETSEAWDISRISKIDLAIMRLAVYEILHDPNISEGVAINEAVELAKVFSTEDGSKFVNGVLGKIARTFKANES